MLSMENQNIIEQALASQWLKSLDNLLESSNLAQEYDPRDAQAAFEAFRLELQKAPEAVDACILVEFLTFHRAQIKPSLSGHIFKTLSHAYAESNAALASTDIAAEDGNRIAALLQKAADEGTDIRKLCDELRGKMSSPDTRAGLFIGIGDHYLVNCGSESDAAKYYAEALNEKIDSVAAIQRLLALAEHANDWTQAVEQVQTLIMSVNNDAERIRYMLKQAWIERTMLKDTNGAVKLLREVLSIDPANLDAFVRIAEIYEQQGKFESLKFLIAKLISSRKAEYINYAAAICKKFGDRMLKADDIEGASEAYQLATDLLPKNIGLHTVLAKLYESDELTLEKAVIENRKILAYTLEHPTAMQDLARCYRMLGRFDESLCTYRVLNTLNPSDEEARVIVEKFADKDIQITQKIPDEVWYHIIPSSLDNSIVQIMKYCTKIIGDLFSNDFETYRINEKESFIDISADTTFNNTIRNETEALGFAEVPLLYRCDRYSGVTNAYFTNRSFLIHPNCLSGRSHKELAFMTAKALLLMRPEFYLLQLGPRNVELVLRAIFQTIKPSLGLELDKNQMQVSKYLLNALTPELYKVLAGLVKDVYDRNAFNPSLFVESVEDFANRTGLLFCNSIAVIEQLLAEESNAISTRTPNERLRSLIIWAISDDYFTVRQKLNIALKAS